MLTTLAVVFGVIVLLNLISLLINQVFFSNELDDIVPYGELVEVNGEKMHVYTMGNGRKTILLLPGFGLPLPSADFAPLMRELSKEYTVISIDYFGVGFSDTTDVPRTNENYIKKIRVALNAAGFSPPYVLMPHSGSGIYTEYYATKYPDEVSAIIMIDTTSSAELTTKVPRFVYGLAKLQQATNLMRPFNSIVVKSTLGISEDNGYTKSEIADYIKFMNHYYNDTIVDQLSRLNDNIEEVMTKPFPSEVPVLKLVASETAKKKQSGEEYQNAHINRLGANSQWVMVGGNHFLYHGHIEDVVNAVGMFLHEK